MSKPPDIPQWAWDEACAWLKGLHLACDLTPIDETILIEAHARALLSAYERGRWPDFPAPPQYADSHPSWEDTKLPDFRLIWKVARDKGYAVGLHGSMRRDCDLIAVPWTTEAASPDELIGALSDALGVKEIGDRETKPLGRIAVNLQSGNWVKLIDLSIVDVREAT